MLNGAFGDAGWEIRIGAAKAGGVVDQATATAAATATATAHKHVTHDPNWVPPHERANKPEPNDGKVRCAVCGKGRHLPEFDQCYTCKLREDGEDVDTLVRCAYCQVKRHKAIYQSCWDCRAAAAYQDGNDGDYDC